MKPLIFAALTACMLLAAGCSKPPAAVPRRTAYPRAATLDSAMVSAPGAPLHFVVNASAIASSSRPGWLDIAYPMYGAVAHVTFSCPGADSLGLVQANRLERAILNTGGLPTRRSEWTNPAGFDILTFHTDGCTTPFQFLATDGRANVVSGAVYFRSPHAIEATDSIAPMLRAIEADLTRGLNSLRP